MEAPLCKLCGRKHWQTEPHDWSNRRDFRVVERPPARVDRPRAKNRSRVSAEKNIAEKPKEIKEKKKRAPIYDSAYKRVVAWREKNQEKYRAFMREYMRKRRERK